MDPEHQAAAPLPRERRRHKKRFNLAHSVAGVALLLALQGTVGSISEALTGAPYASVFVVLVGGLIGGLGIILIATEVIREVRQAMLMLALLSAVLVEF